MNKIFIVIKREYLSRVNKKSFLLMTLLVPVLMIGFYGIIIAISVSDTNGKSTIAVIDEAKLLDASKLVANENLSIKMVGAENAKDFQLKFQDLGFDAYLHIQPFQPDSAASFTLFSSRSADLSTSTALENLLNDAIREKRLKAIGMSPETYKALTAEVKIQNKVMTDEGDKTSIAEIGYLVSFFCGFLIYIMMMVYGTQVMRGVMEEKTNRISEVMVSSIKPFQLMLGKIIGIGAVGLTQFLIWIILILALGSFLPMMSPDLMNTASRMPAEGTDKMIHEIGTGLASLPFFKIIVSFLLYFLLGYLTYAALFAAIGSAAGEDPQEAQQLVFPVMMPVIIGFVMMTSAAKDPYSDMAVFGSYFPLTSPIVMMARVGFDIPWTEILLSVSLLLGCFIFFTWISGKIYRVGILMYGKKASWKEIFRWAFKKD